MKTYHRQRRSLLAAFLAVVMLFSLMPTAFAAQEDNYHDPAEHWQEALNRTNELDANAVVTYETFPCPSCDMDTSFIVYRVPEYTRTGETALNRGISFSDGTLTNGGGTGNLDDGTPGVDAYYTGCHWTKAVCQNCGTINANMGVLNYAYNKNIYWLFTCYEEFYEPLDETREIEQVDDTYHRVTTASGRYCGFCYGTFKESASSMARHGMETAIRPELAHDRFVEMGTCADCGYSETAYTTAKTVVADYFGTADGQPHTVTVSDLSDEGVTTAIRYGNEANSCTLTSAPNYTEAGDYQVLPDTKKQFDTLAALMRDSRVDSLVCATDAGREGELIFRLVYEAAGCEKPVKRLWISSMEEDAIRKGYDSLLDSGNYDNLYAAALCRQKADWLVGINATRLFTTVYKGKTLNVGRVMTPTLALLTDREAAIASFQKEKFYTVELDYGTLRAVSERFSSKTDATRLRAACVGKTAEVRAVERKERTERTPKLYDLTTLQREANRLFGYTAQQTLDYAQLLYEKKLATYPRTDSRYLVSGMEAGLPALCGTVSAVLSLPLVESPEAGQVINDSKVSDHHALLPTADLGRTDLAALPTGERNVLTLIAARLLCAVGSPCRYAESAAVLECGGASFTAKGRTMLEAGWKAVERAVLAGIKKGAEAEKQNPPLPELEEGQRLEGVDAALRTGTTSPPPHFTEDTLLSAMEHASAEDFAELEDAEHTGLGTPATRASTIEKLVRSGFAERKGRQLLPTEKGTELIRVMPDALKSARLTAEWEAKLGEVERGTLPPGGFLAGIEGMVRQLVQTYASVTVASSALSGSGRPIVGVCPRCGKKVVEGRKSFFCEGYHDTPPCGFAMWKNDHFFTGKRKELTRKIAAALLKHGRVHMKDLFSEKKGVLYDATVVLDDTGGKYVRYKLEFDKKGKDTVK